MKLKKVFLFILVTLLLLTGMELSLSAQPVQGTILADTGGIKVIKVWGTHHERGYAYGYLVGSQAGQLANNYIKPLLGSSYSTARNMVTNGMDLAIDSIYILEAQAVIEGMNAAGTNSYNLDYIDLLVANCVLDVLSMTKKKSGMGCSSLMSWGDATTGTSLNGYASVCRHLDWQVNSNLINNQVIVIHIPAEPGEQKWAMVGFAGMISVLSGFNQQVGVFQHQLDDMSSAPSAGQQYLPVWFAMRKAIEMDDVNQDGSNNVMDVRDILSSSQHGFADGYIVTALAESANLNDSLIALVAELATVAPTHSYRFNTFPDSIPGDNLYAANYQIIRNNMMHFCNRYNAIRSNIGDGTLIDLTSQWNLMRDYSHQSSNIQFMQYSPESDFFRISTYGGGQAAYQRTPVALSLSWLFEDNIGIPDRTSGQDGISCYPNPVTQSLFLSDLPETLPSLELTLCDVSGRAVRTLTACPVSGMLEINLEDLKPGLYFISLKGRALEKVLRIVKM